MCAPKQHHRWVLQCTGEVHRRIIRTTMFKDGACSLAPHRALRRLHASVSLEPVPGFCALATACALATGLLFDRECSGFAAPVCLELGVLRCTTAYGRARVSRFSGGDICREGLMRAARAQSIRASRGPHEVHAEGLAQPMLHDVSACERPAQVGVNKATHSWVECCVRYRVSVHRQCCL